MKWIFKAAVQKAVSYLPFSEQINYFFQVHISKSIPVSEKEIVSGRGGRAIQHLSFLRQYAALDIGTAVFYEFGAGSDLPVPLIFYMAGVNRQLLVDIEPHIRLSLVNDMIKKLNNCGSALFGKRNYRRLEKEITSVKDLHTHYGIYYSAPLDARHTGLADCSVDCCTNTFTLEHIPEADILLIFKELYRILKPGGVVSCFVDMNDHYAYADPSVNIYNFLKFSKATWRWINSGVHYQNRLRHPDYHAIYTACGFEVVQEEVKVPDERHAAFLKNTKINKEFAGYSLEALGIRSAKTLLRKKS